jgi:regulator of nucleoside diphosphate kinase
MDYATHDERTLTELDYTRVSGLLSGSGAAPTRSAQPMQEMLDSSALVPSTSVPPTVVTMYSRVLLAEPWNGNQFEVISCYPPDADPSIGRVSVLSPAGAALLGLRAGAVARWRATTGAERAARIVSILFQPEAAGDYLR